MAAKLRYSCAINPGNVETSFMKPIFHRFILNSTFLLNSWQKWCDTSKQANICSMLPAVNFLLWFWIVSFTQSTRYNCTKHKVNWVYRSPTSYANSPRGSVASKHRQIVVVIVSHSDGSSLFPIDWINLDKLFTITWAALAFFVLLIERQTTSMNRGDTLGS
jgi:hypothetical protein